MNEQSGRIWIVGPLRKLPDVRSLQQQQQQAWTVVSLVYVWGKKHKSILWVKHKQRAAGDRMSFLSVGEIVNIPVWASGFVCASTTVCVCAHTQTLLLTVTSLPSVSVLYVFSLSLGTDLCPCGSWSSRPSGWRGRGLGWGAPPPGSAHSRGSRDAHDRTGSWADTRCSLSTARTAGRQRGGGETMRGRVKRNLPSSKVWSTSHRPPTLYQAPTCFMGFTELPLMHFKRPKVYKTAGKGKAAFCYHST